MIAGAIAYLVFTAGLSAVFVGIIAYYFRPERRDRVEEPKHRMLDDDK